MEGFNLGDIISLIIVMVVYLLAASSGKKKGKKKAQRGPMRSRVQGERHDSAAKAENKQAEKGFPEAFAHSQRDASCEARSIHLHETTQQQFADAAEGEDPCHAGGMRAAEHDFGASDAGPDAQTLAQDVLRGVIMHEILTRPCERNARTALQRSRR